MTLEIGVRADTASRTWRPLVAVPNVNLGFSEVTPAVIGPVPGPGWRLFVDDASLPERVGCEGAEWTWTPGFYAGEVAAELVSPSDAVAARYLFDVSPNPAKTGRDTFQTMLDRLWEHDPSFVLGEEPSTTRIGALGDRNGFLLALARLRQHGPAFVRALEGIARGPIRSLRRGRRLASPDRVRRTDSATLLSALRSPDLLLRLEGEVSEEDPPTMRELLDVPITEEHLDGAANRCIVALARRVVARIDEVLRALEEEPGRERDEAGGTRTETSTRTPRRVEVLRELRFGVVRVLRRQPFSSVTRAEITAAGLTACAAHPSYARASAAGWRATRAGVEGLFAADERLWISPTWEIYERWCALEVAALVQSSWSALRWAAPKRVPGCHRMWRGEGDGLRVTLEFQKTFRAADKVAHGPHACWSVSGELVPDLVLTVEIGGRRSVLVLDAKYRVTRENVLDAMRSAHLYRDALRVGGVTPVAALLLVPSGGGAPWLEDVDVQRSEGVGVVVLDAIGGAAASDRSSLKSWFRLLGDSKALDELVQ